MSYEWDVYQRPDRVWSATMLGEVIHVKEPVRLANKSGGNPNIACADDASTNHDRHSANREAEARLKLRRVRGYAADLARSGESAEGGGSCRVVLQRWLATLDDQSRTELVQHGGLSGVSGEEARCVVATNPRMVGLQNSATPIRSAGENSFGGGRWCRDRRGGKRDVPIASLLR